MFTKVVSVVLVAAALASAQSSISLPAGLPSIDSCTQNCLTQAATANGCTLTDVTCVCSNTAFQQAVASCLQSGCPSADLSTALALENAICGGTSASASASSAATSAASSAASSASSVASSNSATAGSATSHASSAATSAASSLSSAASSAANSLSSAASSAVSSLSSQLSSATSAGASGSASAGNAVAVNMHGLVGLGVALVGVAAGAGLVL
ncbi:hypothetical protein PHLGIDRAFT_16131 [Phlebiopsis gigantea 11061_1 CR5-6]|uniref:CFEM domain-containing protein n=1 Tax=Phlebiopsis gigantea (strain 11061_1 CR5-6) TaxID=745531 RepID=A0A0C3PCY8_PHLG1|nr:hypothetical protein PHLGIDRAFT_16131 [Phlebiopsis gigantea 11061_1 CR5-6]